MDGYWVWCGSPIRAEEDGCYHLFASRWPKSIPFDPFFLTDSEIVRASSDTPAGPYRFEEVVLARRGQEFWDGKMTHNPTIHRCPQTGTYLLYYIGTTFPGEGVLGGSYFTEPFSTSRAKLRIGLATSPSIFGPWTRRDRPIFEPRPGKWDGMQMSNPAPCVLDDGSIFLAYKGVAGPKTIFRYGMVCASRFDAPYERLCDEPVFDFGPNEHVEDAYLWHENGQFNILMKDMNGGITGEHHAGLHATSPDAIHWTVGSPCKAYSRKMSWDDGTTTIQGSLERPQLLIENGHPTHLFAATADGPGGFQNASNTWNMVIPLVSR
jgi:hypothetical protein